VDWIPFHQKILHPSTSQLSQRSQTILGPVFPIPMKTHERTLAAWQNYHNLRMSLPLSVFLADCGQFQQVTL
jgi:hypothetical protein